MKNRFILLMVMLTIGVTCLQANRRTRQIDKINNALQQEAITTSELYHGKKIDEITIFDKCHYDIDNREFIYYEIIVEDLIDISTCDTVAMKNIITDILKNNRGIVDALLAVGGSIKYVYVGDTSGQSFTIEFTYWDLNNIPYF